MSALLPQPGGFEGLSFGQEVAPPDALAPPPAYGQPDRDLKWHGALGAVASVAHDRKHQVIAQVAYLDELRGEVRHPAEQALPRATDSIVALVVVPNTGKLWMRPHVLGHKRQEPAQIPSVDRVRDAVGQLDVFLRHRPRSISRLWVHGRLVILGVEPSVPVGDQHVEPDLRAAVGHRAVEARSM